MQTVSDNCRLVIEADFDSDICQSILTFRDRFDTVLIESSCIAGDTVNSFKYRIDGAAADACIHHFTLLGAYLDCGTRNSFAAIHQL